MDAYRLNRLPHEVVLSQRLLARLGCWPSDGAAAVALGFGLGAVALRFPADPTLRPILLFVGVGMSLAGLTSVAPTVLVAHAFGYSDSAPVVLLEVATVAICCAARI